MQRQKRCTNNVNEIPAENHSNAYTRLSLYSPSPIVGVSKPPEAPPPRPPPQPPPPQKEHNGRHLPPDCTDGTYNEALTCHGAEVLPQLWVLGPKEEV